MAQIIYPDGTRKDVTPKNEKTFELEELQNIVGGYIDIVCATNGGTLVIDDEGRLKGMPINPTATKMYKYNCDGLNFIVGTVLYVPENEQNLLD